MADPSQIYFPLGSNASALMAGAGVASVRRRILAAALLMDQVILETGLFSSWAGATGGWTMVGRQLDGPVRWQSAKRRGRATGATHYVAIGPDNSTAPRYPLVKTEATFSWQATFEPFRRELPRPFPRWLAFGHVSDDREIKAIAKAWKDADQLADVLRYRAGPRPPVPGGQFVHDAILNAGYLDLATAAATRSAVSVDRRHALALRTRVEAGHARPLGGAYALEVLLPYDFSWADVGDLRRHPALKSYRAIVREIEAAALASATGPAELDDAIRRDYQAALLRAATRGVPLTGRVALMGVGMIAGAAADAALPIVGGMLATAGGFVAGEVLDHAVRPRWVAIDRRLGGRRNGL